MGDFYAVGGGFGAGPFEGLVRPGEDVEVGVHVGFVLGDCNSCGGLVKGEEVLGYGGAGCVFFGVGLEGFEGFGGGGGGPEDVVVGCDVEGGRGGFLLLAGVESLVVVFGIGFFSLFWRKN